MRNGQVRLAAPMWTADTLSPVERCSLRCLGQDAAAGRPQGFVPPPDELRGACDHNDGGLLPWQYGEKASFSAPVLHAASLMSSWQILAGGHLAQLACPPCLLC